MLKKLFQQDNQDVIITSLYTKLTISCCVIHILLALLFISVNIVPLVVYNFISCMVYFGLYYLTKNNLNALVTFFSFFEVSLCVFISSVFLGWDNGFYLYLVTLVPIGYFCKFRMIITKFLLSLWLLFSFMITYYYLNTNSALYPTKGDFVNIMFAFNAILCFFVLSMMSYVYSKASNTSNIKLREKNKNLQILASTDPLTGLLNRRSMFKKLEKSKILFDSEKEIFSLILIDIDNFKFINDDYGHESGDIVLNNICNIIKSTVRKDDTICRWGGEEILILLPNTDLSGGIAVAEKLRGNVEAYSTIIESSHINTTITAGVCCSSDGDTISELVKLADKCLYEGKAAGKNCVKSSRIQAV